MKKILLVVLSLVLLFPVVASAESIDLSLMTQEELVAARDAINSRLLHVEKDDVLYDEDGLLVSWKGISEYHNDDIIVNLAITNQMDEDIYIDMTSIAINGYKLDYANAMSAHLESGLSILTGTNHHWLISKETLNEHDIHIIESVYVELAVMDKEKRYSDAKRIPLSVNTSISMP